MVVFETVEISIFHATGSALAGKYYAQSDDGHDWPTTNTYTLNRLPFGKEVLVEILSKIKRCERYTGKEDFRKPF